MTARHRLLIAIAAVAVLTVPLAPYLSRQTASAVQTVRRMVQSRRGEVRNPLILPFEVHDSRHPTVPPGLTCAQATDSSYAFAAYEQVRTALTTGGDTRSVEYLDCFLPDRDTRESSSATLEHLVANVFDSDVMYAYLAIEFEKLLFDSARKGGLRHWKSSHLGLCALLAFDRTGERRFVELYVGHFKKLLQMRDSVLGLADDFHGRVMDSWGATNLGENAGDPTRWIAHVTHFSVVMLPATGFAARIRRDPALSEFADAADQIVEFFDRAYRQFDVDLRAADGTSEVWYWRPLADIFEATNHLHLQGQALLNMYEMTRDEFYRERLRGIVRVFERGVRIDSRGFVAWNYYPYLQVTRGVRDAHGRLYSELIWKASHTVPFLYQGKTTEFAIAPEILAATTRTIREHVVANNDYALHLHPKDSGPLSKRAQRRDSNEPEASITGFLSAASEDPAIAERIQRIVATRRDLYPSGWFRTPRLARGYAFFLRTDLANAHAR